MMYDKFTETIHWKQWIWYVYGCVCVGCKTLNGACILQRDQMAEFSRYVRPRQTKRKRSERSRKEFNKTWFMVFTEPFVVDFSFGKQMIIE